MRSWAPERPKGLIDGLGKHVGSNMHLDPKADIAPSVERAYNLVARAAVESAGGTSGKPSPDRAGKAKRATK